MASRKCPDCGMAHDRPRWQATPDNRVAGYSYAPWQYFGCGLLTLAAVVAFLWAIFLLWPV